MLPVAFGVDDALQFAAFPDRVVGVHPFHEQGNRPDVGMFDEVELPVAGFRHGIIQQGGKARGTVGCEPGVGEELVSRGKLNLDDVLHADGVIGETVIFFVSIC